MSSVYPGALDTDATLYVAKDNISTKLISAQAIGDTVAVVANPAGWAPNMILTIGTEQQFVTLVVGNTITVVRAFGSTVAVAHPNGSVVSNNVDAAYQSTLKSAVIAVETALGANLSNIATAPVTNTAPYNFAPLTPGGSLGVGANTITLSPMPAGINSVSVNLGYLYISGGTGTAEQVLVIGATSTTVTVTCAHTHSGAWTIRSATAGAQEAVCYALLAGGGFASVRMPAGQFSFTAGVFFPSGVQVSFRGGGVEATKVNPGTLEQDIFHFNPGSNVDFGDLTISSGTYQSTNVGVYAEQVAEGLFSNFRVAGPNTGVLARSTARVKFDNLTIEANSVGMQFDSSSYPNTSQVTNIRILNTTNTVGLLFKASCAGMLVNNIYIEDGTIPIRILGDGPGVINEIQFNHLILDSQTAIAVDIFLSDPTAGSSRVSISNMIAQSTPTGLSGGGSYGIAARSAIAGQIVDLSISNSKIVWFSNGAGAIPSGGMIFAGTEGLKISDVECICGDGFGSGVEFTAPGSENTIIGGACRFGQALGGASSGAGIAQRGILIGAQAHTDLFVDGVRLAGSIATVTNNSTDLTTVEFTDTCRALPVLAIGSAAAFPLPAFPNFTITATTGITSVTGIDVTHGGRHGTFITTDGAVVFTAGASIGSSGTTTQEKLYEWYSDGTKFWVIGPGF